MLERIERIAKIKPVENFVRHKFDSQGYGDNKNRKFAGELKRVLNKKSDDKSVDVPVAYNLDLDNSDVPLFYFSNLDLGALLR